MREGRCSYKAFIFLLGVLVLLCSPSVQAAPGCFLYPESSFYCTSVEPADAVKECKQFADCSFENYFSTAVCEDESDCQKIVCKSTCSLEFSGNCPTGEISKGEEKEWCGNGCCQFTGVKGTQCFHSDSKWLCEVAAQNKDASLFKYAAKVGQEECSVACATNFSDFEIEEEKVSPIVIASSAGSSSKSTITSKGNVTSSSASGKSNFSLLWIIIGMGVVVVAVFFMRKKLLSMTLPSLPISEKSESTSKKSWFSFPVDLLLKEQREKSQQQHRRKIKQSQRQETLLEEGLVPEKSSLKPTPSEFHKLTHIISSIQKRQHFSSLSASSQTSLGKKTVFQNLEEVTTVMKAKEEQEQLKKEASQVLDVLKKMVSKPKK